MANADTYANGHRWLELAHLLSMVYRKGVNISRLRITFKGADMVLLTILDLGIKLYGK